MNLSDLRKQYSINDVLRTNKKWMVCPLPMHHHSRNPSPSFSIYWKGDTQRFRCHGKCEKYGDVIDLVGYMNLDGYDGSFPMRKKAAQILSGGRYEVTNPIAPPPAPPLSSWLADEFMPPSIDVKSYIIKRGVSPRHLEPFKIGSAVRIEGQHPVKGQGELLMSMPTFHQGKLMGIKLRKLAGEKNYRYFSVSGSQPGLWNYDSVFLTDGIVFVVKGEIAGYVMESFMQMHEIKAKVCAPTAGETGPVHEFIPVLSFAKVIVLGDNDKDPDTRRKIVAATERRANTLGGIVRFPPEKYKDIDDFILHEPHNALDLIRSWIKEYE